MSTPTTSTSVSSGSSLGKTRESLLNTPAILLAVVAIMAVLVLDVAIPKARPGTPEAAASLIAGFVIGGGTLVLLIVRWRAHSRIRSLLHSLTNVAAVGGLTSLELHDLVVAALLRRGWHLVHDQVPAPQDAVVMTSDRVRRAVFFVSAKMPIGADTVRRLQTDTKQQARPLLVTSATFAPEAIVFARQIGVELVDGQGVLTLMGELRGENNSIGPLPSPTFVWEDEVLHGHPRRLTPSAPVSNEKVCPECAGPMKAQQTSTTRYWACSRFPDCNGMIITQ